MTIITMANDQSISGLLRKAILDSGLPMIRIAEATGIQRASLIRFTRGDQSLRLDVADKLAEFFGLKLKRTKKPKG